MLVCLLALLTQTAAPPAPELTSDQAVAIALVRNRDVIAARLQIEAAQVERVAAGIYPNPDFSYQYGNIILGKANDQGVMSFRPGPFDESVQTLAVSQLLDVWFKRSARKQTADRGIDQARFQLEDALREVVYAVRSAFADLLREQKERELARETRARYDETVRLSRARYRAGDISEAELKKIELESLKYQNAEIDADMELDLARQKLAALLGYGSTAALPSVAAEVPPDRAPLSLPDLTARALARRPDLAAVRMGRSKAEAELRAARRESLPDPSLGIAYTHDDFVVSGDNPNTLALVLSFPLPLFDRNQAGIGRARVDVQRADNDEQKLTIEIQRQVAESVRRSARARKLLDGFEGGGMLDRAASALRTAEKSYQAGAVSLLELLEAQRTALETRAQYLRATYDAQQAGIDVAHAVGGDAR